MSSQRKVKELYPRAPRYRIELGDNEVVRFAHMPRGSKAMHTRIINLSESGMAFLVPYLTAPQLDEKIKVEFSAPNTPSIACYAKVVRVQVHQTYHSDRNPQTFKMVAVEFEQLHPKQRQMLALGLTEQFRKKQREYERKQLLLKIQWFFISLPSQLWATCSRVFARGQSTDLQKRDPANKDNYIDV